MKNRVTITHNYEGENFKNLQELIDWVEVILNISKKESNGYLTINEDHSIVNTDGNQINKATVFLYDSYIEDDDDDEPITYAELRFELSDNNSIYDLRKLISFLEHLKEIRDTYFDEEIRSYNIIASSDGKSGKKTLLYSYELKKKDDGDV